MKKGKLAGKLLAGALGISLALGLSVGLTGVEAKAASQIQCEADGTDQLDDTAEIQACLDKAKGSDTPVTITIPAGTYYISKTLTIYSNTYLTLADNTEIVRTDGSNIMIRSEQDYDIGGYGQAENITIEGGIWNGNVTDSTILCPLMYFCHAQNITLKDFSIKSACSKHMIIMAGIDTASVSGVSFSDFVLYTGDDADSDYYVTDGESEAVSAELAMRTMEALHLDCIAADGSSESMAYPCDGTVNKDITVENCTFTGCMSGVGNHYSKDASVKGSGLTIQNNTFTDMTYTCINIYNQNDVLVQGNTANDSGELVRVVNSSGTISENDFVIRENAGESEMELCGIKVTNAENLNIIGNDLEGGRYGISLSGVTGEVSNNQIRNADLSGITVLDKSDMVIRQNTIQTPGENGLYAENSTTEILTNNLVSCKQYGIAVYSSDGSISTNKITDAASYGICMNNSTMTVSGNEVSNAGSHGIYALEGSDVTIEENTVASVSGNGIYLNGAIGSVEKNTITDTGASAILIFDSKNTSDAQTCVLSNKITGTTQYGIRIEESSEVLARDNTVEQSVLQGISLYDTSDVYVLTNTIADGSVGAVYAYNTEGTTISSNILTGTKEAGIAVYSSSSLLLSANSVDGFANGILINGTSGTVSGNTVSNPSAKGIYIYKSANSASTRTKIHGNTITGAGDRGIQLEGSTYITVSSNTVQKCTMQGIRVILSNDNIRIENNVVRNNAQHGIIIDASTNVTVTENLVVGNQTKDISVLSESTGSAKNNAVDSVGVYTYDSKAFPITAETYMIKAAGTWIYQESGIWNSSYTGMAKK